MPGEIHEQDHHEYVNRKVTFFTRAFSWKGTVWCSHWVLLWRGLDPEEIWPGTVWGTSTDQV